MKTAPILLFLAASSAVARADVFAFKDLAGFETCLTLDHLVETVTTDKGQQTRFLDQREVQARCIESAVRLLAGGKDKDRVLDFVKTTRRLVGAEASLDLVTVLAATSVTGCNDLAAYEAILAGLSQRAEDTLYLPKTRKIVKRCLGDASFKKDFLDEQDNSDARIRSNACQILVEEKLVKACRRSK
jgi:hypothetical protein